MPQISDAANRLIGQKMFQILAKAQELERQGKEILHFEIGDPDFNTPENIVSACHESLKKGDTHYTASSGIFPLKVAFSEAMESGIRKFKPDIDQILVTPGANSQIYYALACGVNPGEEVIIPDPSFVSYNAIISFLGMKAVSVPLKEENEFRLNPDDVEKVITDKTKMIIINSPNNPTGSVMKEDELRKIYELCEKNDIYLLSDEIYSRMIYKDRDNRYFSPSVIDKCKKHTILINGFSKSFAMTGWRLGICCGPEEIIKKMGLLLESTTSCVSPFVQKAGIEALKGSQEPINNMMEEFSKRRDILVKGLNTLPGVSCIVPDGAFYAFCNIKKTGMGSEKFTEVMLNEAGVSTCPGNYFGDSGEGYVRFCYANSRENIKRGIDRMSYVLKKIVNNEKPYSEE
ncbi:pyridoxal phosphate-dependent aminotransferase [Candidatus Pacearchaeota archaeon]|nr:pyridoxal phosphate-dependent aminotransferase [Candidatus Pacearchaeota archaeon]